jgi:hypothetical protein
MNIQLASMLASTLLGFVSRPLMDAGRQPVALTESPGLATTIVSPAAIAVFACTGCGSTTTGSTAGSSHGGATLSITVGVVRNGKCDSGCRTETTCRFFWDVSLSLTPPTIVRGTAWVCPTGSAGNPTDPPCGKSVAFHTANFSSSSTGLDLVCGRSEQVIYNVVENPDGSGTTLGTMRLNCGGCTAGTGG